ncbi:MAG: condensation domain-containing protein, partial [Bacteroidota bacterium]|nr:condensation domain-containing protein [Bacteroidota bacterium]
AWTQINQDARFKNYKIEFYDLSNEDDVLGQISKIGETLQSGLDITKGSLLKVAHFRLKDGDRLGLIIHHLVVDGVSWRILLEDLSILYKSYKEGKKPDLVLKTDSFQKWALLQKEYGQSNKIKKQKVYWAEQCSQNIDRLPQDKKVNEDEVIIDSIFSFCLDKVTTELLQTRVHRVYNTEINDLLLTGLGLAIKEVFSRDKSVLQMEGHGREDIIDGVDISRTVGWFTSMYPFVLDVSKTLDPLESLVRVKEALRKMPNKGIGYGILKYLSTEKIQNILTPEIMFNYLGDFGKDAGGGEQNAPLFEYASESIGQSLAKENRNYAILDVSGMLVMGELNMSIQYSKSRYDSTTIEKLTKSYEKNLKFLIEELSKSTEKYLTPSDLSFKGLTPEELSEINLDNNLEDIYELSPLQKEMYHHWLFEKSNTLYFEQTSYRIKAQGLEIEKLKRAYDNLVARHGVLRTSFSNDYAGKTIQIVRKLVQSNFSYEQIENQKDKQQYVEEVNQKDREKGFDLTSPSQMRLHIIDLREGEYEFIWSHHHILMDGWCISVLINDFNELLRSENMNSKLALASVIPYSNYINWLNTINRESSLDYWKNYLTNYSQIAEIPFKIKTEKTRYVESRERLQIEGDLFNKVDAFCNQTGITHNTFIQGVWGYLLSCYNNTNDVVFGVVVSGRPAELVGIEDMIGLFINIIPVRVKYEINQTPLGLLKALREQSIQSTFHHYMNLSEVQSQSELGVNLISHIIRFQNFVVNGSTSEKSWNAQREEEPIRIESTKFFEQLNYDFNLVITPSSSSLFIDIIFNTNNYDGSLFKQLKWQLDNLIWEFIENANLPLNAIIPFQKSKQQIT